MNNDYEQRSEILDEFEATFRRMCEAAPPPRGSAQSKLLMERGWQPVGNRWISGHVSEPVHVGRALSIERRRDLRRVQELFFRAFDGKDAAPDHRQYSDHRWNEPENMVEMRQKAISQVVAQARAFARNPSSHRQRKLVGAVKFLDECGAPWRLPNPHPKQASP